MTISKKTIVVGVGVTGGTFLILAATTVLAITQPLWNTASRSQLPTPNTARLEAHTAKLAQTFRPRDWAHPEKLDAAAAYIRSEFEKSGGSVSEQTYQMGGKTYRNVVVRFGPDSSNPVIVGAHYDAFGELPGADDNASGIAGLIELAHLIGHTKLHTQVELVAFTLEEPKTLDGPGLFRSEYGGSAVHVRSLSERGVSPRIFICLEMIGYFSEEPGSQKYPSKLFGLLYPSKGDFIAIVGKVGQGRAVRRVKAAMTGASPLPVHSMSAPESIAGVDWSDHANYWKAGFNAVMVTDMGPNRNHAYHTDRDIPARLDYARMAMVVQGVYAAVLDLAQPRG